ncbi:MAG: methyltransferase domain-containing protein [Thermodesulfobacteriota bacterium]
MDKRQVEEFGNPSALAENRLFYKFADSGNSSYYVRSVLFGLEPADSLPIALTPAETRLFRRVVRHQQARLNSVGRFIDAQDRPGLWLDMGCGAGQFIHRMLQRPGNRAVGTELDHKNLAATYKLLEQAKTPPRYSLVCQPPDALPFADESFDYVFSADVMEHVGYENQRAVLREIRRVLAPGGTMILHTPNANRVRFTTVLKKMVYLLKGYNPRTIRHSFPHGHVSLVSGGRLSSLVRESGFTSTLRHLGESPAERFFSRAPLLREAWARSFILVARKSN